MLCVIGKKKTDQTVNNIQYKKIELLRTLKDTEQSKTQLLQAM